MVNPLAALAHDCWKEAADLLQAWLREADKEMLKLCEHDAYIANLVRYELLGTTQSSGVSRGSREGEK